MLDPALVQKLNKIPHSSSVLARLTDTEREVLSHMAQGYSNRAIAETLHIEEGAAEVHISSIYVKLEIPESKSHRQRAQAILAFVMQSTSVGWDLKPAP